MNEMLSSLSILKLARHLSLCGLVGWAGMGCASSYDDESLAHWAQGDAARWQSSGYAHSRGDDAAASSQPTARADPLPPDAGPGEYVAVALERNPSIAAARRNVRRLAARVPQARSLDDPMVQFTPIGEQPETAAGQVDFAIGVSQKLPFPGKRSIRGRIAAQDVAMAAASLQQTKLDVTARTLRAYWSLYAAARDIEVTQTSRGLLAQFKQIAEAKYRSGTARQQDVLRASVELHSLDNDLEALRQKRSAAEAMLNRLLDRPVSMVVPDPSAAPVVEATHSLQQALADAAQSNPSLTRVHEQIEQYRQRLRLARLSRWPDLSVGVNYAAVGDGLASSANGKDQLYLNLGFNLPIWGGRLDAAEREAHQGILQSLAELQAEHNRVDYEVREAFDRMQTHYHHVQLLRDQIIPEAKQTVDASLSQYSAGESDFLAVIDNWRRLLQFEQLLNNHQAMFEQAAADLRQAVGGLDAPPAAVGSTQENPKSNIQEGF